MMKMEKSTKIKIIFISVFFFSTFIAEFFYRPPLFDNSITIAKTLQDKLYFSKKFFSFITKITNYDYIILGIVLYFFPINYSYTFFLEKMASEHLCDFLKLSYGNGRPFLIDKIEANDIFTSCSSSYGNPSGHSFRSISTFLSLAQCFIDFFELRYLYSIFIYIFIAIIVLLVNFSRVILGVHSIDQVIFGDTMGFTTYFIIFQIIKPHKRDITKFFQKFLNIQFHILNAIAFVIILTYTIIGAIIFDREGEEDFEELKDRLKGKCNSQDNAILSYDSTFYSFFFLGYFGMICGITCLTYITNKNFYSNYEELNYYYKNSNYKWYITYPLKVVFLWISYIPYYVSSSKPPGLSPIILYIFGSSIPVFLFGFMLFGPRYIFFVLLKMANKDLYKPKKTIDDQIDYILGQ